MTQSSCLSVRTSRLGLPVYGVLVLVDVSNQLPLRSPPEEQEQIWHIQLPQEILALPESCSTTDCSIHTTDTSARGGKALSYPGDA